MFDIFKRCKHKWYVDGVVTNINNYSFSIFKYCLHCNKKKLLRDESDYISPEGRDWIYLRLLEKYKKANETID